VAGHPLGEVGRTGEQTAGEHDGTS
jgi:hypothetical protein